MFGGTVEVDECYIGGSDSNTTAHNSISLQFNTKTHSKL